MLKIDICNSGITKCWIIYNLMYIVITRDYVAIYIVILRIIYIVISRGHACFRIKYKDPWPLLSSFSVKTHLRLQSSLSFVINNKQICPSFKRDSKTAAASRGRKRSLEGGEETPNKKVY